MKLLLDECVNNYKEFHGSMNFVRVIDVLGRGTKDPIILKYIKGKKLVPVTYDWELMLESLKQGNDVVFIRPYLKQTMLIKAVVEENSKYADPVTYEIIEHDKIIRA